MKKLSLAGVVAAGPMVDTINDMAVHFNDGTEYLPEFMDDLKTCMGKWDDPELSVAADATWSGFVEYF